MSVNRLLFRQCHNLLKRRERERETDRQTDRQTERERERENGKKRAKRNETHTVSLGNNYSIVITLEILTHFSREFQLVP